MIEDPWPEVQVSPNYWVRFEKISDHIIFTRPRGVSSVENVQRVWELRNEFVANHLGASKRFVEIKSYRHIPGIPDRAVRNAQTLLFIEDSKHCLGFIACGMSAVVRSILRVGIILNRSTYPFEVVNSYDQALHRARVLETQWIESHTQTTTHPLNAHRWEWRNGETRVRFEIPEPHIFYLSVEGALNEEDMPGIFAVHQQALQSGQLDANHHYRIADYKGMTKASLGVRLAMAREINRICLSVATPRYSIVVNAPSSLKAMIIPIRRLLPQPIRFTDSYSAALDLIHASMNPAIPNPPTPKRFWGIGQPEDSRIVIQSDDIHRLNDCIGSMIFEHGAWEFPELPTSHPLHSTYETLDLLRLDLSELKQHQVHAQSSLNAAHESLSDALRTKSEFLSNISHEIRTPLNGILGMLQLLKQEPQSEEGREYLDIALSCSRGLLALFNNTLDWNRLEVGRMELQIQPLDLRPFLVELTAITEARCRQQGLQFRLTVAQNLPPTVIADSIRLRQILTNLLDNACKFTARGSISLHVCLESEADGGLWLGFRILDTGIGIPEDAHSRLFKPFSQVDATLSRRYGGSGLGLAIAAQLVKLHGGTMGLSSTEGQGSCFWFRLPMKEPPI